MANDNNRSVCPEPNCAQRLQFKSIEVHRKFKQQFKKANFNQCLKEPVFDLDFSFVFMI